MYYLTNKQRTTPKWRGFEFFRTKGGKLYISPEALMKQRAKYLLMADFFSTLTGLLKFSFQGVQPNQKGIRQAVNENLDDGIKGEYPHFRLDYSKIHVAEGSMLGVKKVSAKFITTGYHRFQLERS